MKAFATGLIAIIVMAASFVFLLSSICTVDSGARGPDRFAVAALSLLCFVVSVGIMTIGGLNKKR